MGTGAESFQVTTASPSRVAEVLATALEAVKRPAGGLVFVSGALGTRLLEVADAVKALAPPIPVVVAAGSGVLTERGEVEDQSAAAGVVWSGGRVELLPISGNDEDEFGEALARALTDRTGKTLPTVVLFASPDRFTPSSLAPIRACRTTPHLFGGGTVGTPGSAAVFAGGTVEAGPVAMILRGLSPPSIRTTVACRLLGPLRTITEARGAMVLTLDGKPALEVLGELGRDLPERPLILTVLAGPEGASALHGGRPELVIRGVQGLDPTRGGIVVSDEVEPGMRLTFAIRDPDAARDDFEAITRELERDIAGAAPRFGLYFNCSGRGVGLYGAYDVDVRILKQRFAGVPFAGLQTAFEIAPHEGRPTLQLYTGVLGMFTSPS